MEPLNASPMERITVAELGRLTMVVTRATVTIAPITLNSRSPIVTLLILCEVVGDQTLLDTFRNTLVKHTVSLLDCFLRITGCCPGVDQRSTAEESTREIENRIEERTEFR